VSGVDVLDSVIVGTADPHVPVLRPTRALLVVFGVLTLLAVAALFVRPDTTDRFFAWTIKPPITAAFYGAAYLAGCTLVVLSLRADAWVHARAGVVTIFVFTVLSLAATLTHIDKFHLNASEPVARAAAWFWLAVYIVVPVVLVGMIALQARTPGTHPERLHRLPRPLAAALAVEGAVLFAIGVVLFAKPGLLTWPWLLTPLTSRVVGAWLTSFGVAAGLAVYEGDLARLRAPSLGYLVFGVAEIAVLVRYAGSISWRGVTWVYLSFLVLVVLTAAAGVLLTRRSPP
jgi:UPF0716 family protein affecting phage T7 exclusion